jgi:DNA-binding XRE family transcriptional regulator
MNKIKKLRMEKSLTQEELARISDIKISTLQKLEREDANLGKMTLVTAIKLAKGLEIKIEDLI